jgi:hypothetical protein
LSAAMSASSASTTTWSLLSLSLRPTANRNVFSDDHSVCMSTRCSWCLAHRSRSTGQVEPQRFIRAGPEFFRQFWVAAPVSLLACTLNALENPTRIAIDPMDDMVSGANDTTIDTTKVHKIIPSKFTIPTVALVPCTTLRYMSARRSTDAAIARY